MKIRTGFVSNSSSASFVVTWKSNILEWKDDQEDPVIGEDIELVLHRLLGVGELDDDMKVVFNEKDYYMGESFCKRQKEVIKSFKYVVKNTKSLGKGMFETMFWTSMLNSFDDVPALGHFTASIFVHNATARYPIEIIKVEADID